MGWAPNIHIAPKYVRSSPDPLARQKALASAARLLREQLHALRSALNERDVQEAFGVRHLAVLEADVQMLEAHVAAACAAQ
jgi:hypothetical protein